MVRLVALSPVRSIARCVSVKTWKRPTGGMSIGQCRSASNPRQDIVDFLFEHPWAPTVEHSVPTIVWLSPRRPTDTSLLPNHPSPPQPRFLIHRKWSTLSSASLHNLLLLLTHDLPPSQGRPSLQTSLRFLEALSLLFLFPVNSDRSSRDADRDREDGIQSSARIVLD
jgi:hypothetical protein